MLRVRGAPAIGIAAAYGVVLGLQSAEEGEEAFFARLEEVVEYLATSRPTAVNLFWALDRMRRVADRQRGEFNGVEQLCESVLAEAKAIHEEDRRMCHAIGAHGADLLKWGRGSSDSLQCRGIGNCGIRNGAVCVFYGTRSRTITSCLCRRNSAASPGGSINCVGVDAAGH